MSQLMTTPSSSGLTSRAQIDRLCASIRGKLQFMDYLVRAAVADVDRFESETDEGTRLFLRQLIQMHAENLTQESDSMRLVSELCAALEGVLSTPSSNGNGHRSSFRNGDAA